MVALKGKKNALQKTQQEISKRKGTTSSVHLFSRPLTIDFYFNFFSKWQLSVGSL